MDRRRVTDRIALTVSLSLAGALGACASAPSDPSKLAGSYVLTISDADMPATAFYDKRLGERGDAADAMTILTLPFQEPTTPWAQVGVSNSAFGPPQAVDVAPDGRTAFVIESRGEAGPVAITVDDLPAGERLFAVDLSDPLAPRIADEVTVGDYPSGVAVHPGGQYVAVVTREARQQINIVRYVNGAFEGPVLAWPLFGLDDDSAVVTSVSWHPSGRYLAVTLPERDEVMFYEFSRQDDGSLSLLPWGAPVRVGHFPYSGRFTPDGRFFLTTDLAWDVTRDDYLVVAPAGTVSVVRLSETASAFGRPLSDVDHSVVSQQGVGVSPEGLAITPDGRYVVTANLRTSFLPTGDPRLTPGGSLTLLTLDRTSGELNAVGEYELAAMPEGIDFDAKGNFLVVTQFRSFDPRARDGELAFWRLKKGSNPTLEATDFFVGVGRGPHDVRIVR